jgi:hypothetical protein
MKTRIIGLIAGILLLSCAVSAQRNIPQVTLFSSYDLDSTSYVFCDTGNIPTGMSACASGTAANDGWVKVAGHEFKAIEIVIDQLNVTGGIDFKIEARIAATGSASVIWPSVSANKTLTTENEIVPIQEPCYQIRVGMKIGSADDGNDLTTNLEDITVTYAAYRRTL